MEPGWLARQLDLASKSVAEWPEWKRIAAGIKRRDSLSTNDVPGAVPANKDKLAMGSWAEHDDGSLIFVEAVEGGRAVYSMFDVASDPVAEYRDAMPQKGFESQFSWKPGDSKNKEKWTWHDKTPFPWERVFKDFPAGQRAASAEGVLSAAARVAESLHLRAGGVRDRGFSPKGERDAMAIGRAVMEAIQNLPK